MADRPILFSTPMVRALLAGRKTQTRRALKPQPPAWATHVQELEGLNIKHEWRPWGLFVWTEQPSEPKPLRRWPNDGVDEIHGWHGLNLRITKGDRLWVRESGIELLSSSIKLFAHDAARGRYWTDADGGRYGASYSEAITRESMIRSGRWKVRPSIFMPRWASRLTLTVTDVRVQRLLEISEEDAVAEGIRFTDFGIYQPPGEMSVDGGRTFHKFKPRQHDGWHWQETAKPDECLNSASSAYCNLWNHINGDGSATANPWVAAYTFTVERRNIDRAVD